MTCLPVCRLEADSLETLLLNVGALQASQVDIGDAVTREVVQDSPDADGTDDTTSYTGARVVTMTVLVDSVGESESRWALTQKLRAFTAPGIRPRLFVQFAEGDPELMLTLRRGPFSDLWTPRTQDRNKVIVQWVAPSGVIEAATVSQQTVYASGGGLQSGLMFDAEFDWDFGDADPEGSATVINNGTATAYPTLLVYGPCTEPEIRNATQDRTLKFEGLTINAGEFVEINTRAKTIRGQGDPNDSRYNNLDFPGSSWWSLSPGENLIEFTPATYSLPSQCQLVWRDAWL